MIKHHAHSGDGNIVPFTDGGKFTALLGSLENVGGNKGPSGGRLDGGSGYLYLSLCTIGEANIRLEMLVHEHGILNQTLTKTE